MKGQLQALETMLVEMSDEDLDEVARHLRTYCDVAFNGPESIHQVMTMLTHEVRVMIKNRVQMVPP